MFILSDHENVFSLRHKRYAKGLLNAINSLNEILGDDVLNEFKIHPKGTGVFCRKKMIPKSSLIVEYLGELFSPSV